MKSTSREEKYLQELPTQLEEARDNLLNSEMELSALKKEVARKQAEVTQKQMKLKMLESIVIQLKDGMSFDAIFENVATYMQMEHFQSMQAYEEATQSSSFFPTKGAERQVFLSVVEESGDKEINSPCVLRKTLSSRNPMDMLSPRYKGMQLESIVKLVLAEADRPLTTTEMAQIIYDAQDENEFKRARNSLSTELRNGAKGNPPKWEKIGRYAYRSHKEKRSEQFVLSFEGGKKRA